MKKILIIPIILIQVSLLAQNLSDSLIAHYTLNGDAKDKMGTNDGSITNVTNALDRKGRNNHAYYFNGNSTANINCGRSTDFEMGNEDFSISVWFKPAAFATTFGYVVGKRGWDNGITKDRVYSLIVTPSKTLIFYYAYDDDTKGSFPETGTLDTNWHHAVVTIDRNDSIKLYLDDVMVSGTDISSKPGSFDAKDGDLMLGNCTNRNEPFNGMVDDVRVYKGRVLSKKDVSDLNKDYITGIRTIGSSSTSLEVYPNPVTNSFLTINNNYITGIKLYKVCDLQGKEIDQITLISGSQSYNTNGLARGIYTISAIGELGEVTQSIKFQKY